MANGATANTVTNPKCQQLPDQAASIKALSSNKIIEVQADKTT
jgi:hypothetical protein